MRKVLSCLLIALVLAILGAQPSPAFVGPPPTFTKMFAPASIALGGVSTLTFTINNTALGHAATGLDFTDALPFAVTVATPANAATTCTGGVLTAIPGTGVVSYTGGSVSAGVSCTVTVDVTSGTLGMHLNTTGDLTSSEGNSGSATDTLTVTAVAVPAMSLWGLLATVVALLIFTARWVRRRSA